MWVPHGLKCLYGTHMGPIWVSCPDSAHMGPICPCVLGIIPKFRAKGCAQWRMSLSPPPPGSLPACKEYGTHMGPRWVIIWVLYGQPIWDRCGFCNRDSSGTHLGTSIWAPYGPHIVLVPGIAFICQVVFHHNMAGTYMSVTAQGSNAQPPD